MICPLMLETRAREFLVAVLSDPQWGGRGRAGARDTYGAIDAIQE